jgi:hypothetical protein
MAYNVYLLNGLPISAKIGRTDLTQTQLTSISSTLSTYFGQIVNAHDAKGGATKYGSASVTWISGATTVAPNELLIYVMPVGATVATAGKLQQGNPPPTEDGLTNLNLNNSSASEVYWTSSDLMAIANLMFHEAMHNKLGLNDAKLHVKDGLAAATVSAATPLTPSNINDMAAALDKPRPQWTAGIKLITDAAAMDDNDPAKGLF